MCGTAQWEWDEDGWAYEPMHHMCPGCAKKEVLSESDDAPKAPGMSVRLYSKATAERLRLKAAAAPPQRPRMRR